MKAIDPIRGGFVEPVPDGSAAERRYVRWFHELDAWTEYWDIYHPETRGRYYFGNGADEPGLLAQFIPFKGYPPAWKAWTQMALGLEPADQFRAAVSVPLVASAIGEIDALLERLFASHFGDPCEPQVQKDYLEGMHRFAIDTLPSATERMARIPDGDWRKRTADRHALDGDLMWFAWALQIEAAALRAGREGAAHTRRTLMLAGAAAGCAANFTWRAHRRTRSTYRPDDATAALLAMKGLSWASDFDAAAAEVHALYRIREWGDDEG